MKKNMKRTKGYFSISAVAKMFSVHQQTIRLYEKEGLISPQRSEGNTRMFSEENIEQLERVIYLTHELGINLAGVQMILKLQKQIDKLQKNMNDSLNQVQEDLKREAWLSKNIIARNASDLLKIKQDNPKNRLSTALQLEKQTSAKPEEETIEIDTWSIEFEE